MNININPKELPNKIKPLVVWLKKHRVVICIISVLLLYGWIIFTINTLSRQEPTQDAIDEKSQSIKRPRIDNEVIEKIEQLQENSTEVQTLFKAARENPFQE